MPQSKAVAKKTRKVPSQPIDFDDMQANAKKLRDQLKALETNLQVQPVRSGSTEKSLIDLKISVLKELRADLDDYFCTRFGAMSFIFCGHPFKKEKN